MAERKKDLPIGYFPEGAPQPKPFVLNWAEPDAAEKFRASTDTYADTCFTDMVHAGHANAKESETVSSTPPTIGNGELADTSWTF